MIGALGILVAIGAFLFLWAMLSYNTMHKVKTQMEELQTNIESLKNEGVVNTQQLSVYKQRYSVKKYDYNQMVTEMPSKMIAIMFKLKPIS